MATQRRLLTWYHDSARDLPWRQTRAPYAVWLSEIMLQQTRVDQARPYYLRFVEHFPTVQDLAAASEDAVLKAWEGLGYYSRARNLHRAAKMIANDFRGAFPRNAEEWRALPGIGRYTANAIASIAFEERVPVVDGNVVRVLSRMFDIAESTDAPETQEKLWTLAEWLLPSHKPGDFNQAMMELGARVCTPRKPACDDCPVARVCAARAAKTQEQRPVRAKKSPVPHHEVVAAVIQDGDRLLIGRRASKGLLGGLWEFPGGKVKPGETHQQALEREVQEELGVRVKVGGLVASVQHAYSHFRITLSAYRCRITGGDPVPHSHTELRWVRRDEFSDYAFPKANHKFLDLV